MEEQTPTLQPEPEPDHGDSPTSTNGKRPQSQIKDGTKVPRKKPKSEHVHLPASDVRSNYHKIFEMIFNGCPKSIAAKNFRTICAEDCVFVSRSINNPFGPNYREVRGVSSMVEYVDAALEAIPDCIFAILDSKFFRKAQNESMIISSYTVNGRMIFTIDSLDTEDVEDIDSAISGLQMLYQGRCGTGNEADIDEAAQIICNNVQSAAIKKEEPYPSGKDDSIYSFVYQPTANEAAAAAAMIASTRSTHNNSSNSLTSHSDNNNDMKTLPSSNNTVKALPMDALRLLSHSADSYPSAGTTSSGVSGSNSRDASPFNSTGISLGTNIPSTDPAGSAIAPVVPFDYSLKFTSTGASLFEPPTGASDDEDDEPLESLGINPSMPGSNARGAGSVNSGGSRPSVRDLAKHRNSNSSTSNTSTISMLANSSSDRIGKRLIQSTTNGASGASTGAASTGTGAAGQSAGMRELSAASKEFWQKQRSNVMIVKEQAKFCLKERVPVGQQIYKVKGTLTLHLNADKKVKRIEMLNSFDVSMHR